MKLLGGKERDGRSEMIEMGGSYQPRRGPLKGYEEGKGSNEVCFWGGMECKGVDGWLVTYCFLSFFFFGFFFSGCSFSLFSSSPPFLFLAHYDGKILCV